MFIPGPTHATPSEVVDYKKWLYADESSDESATAWNAILTTNTSSSYTCQLAPSTGENPKLEVAAPPSFTLSTELYSAMKCYTPKKIIRNGPATIVMWPDNTKTVVKRADGEEDNTYSAFCAALAIKIFGSNSKLKKTVKTHTEEQK